jgi:hypothetical protein
VIRGTLFTLLTALAAGALTACAHLRMPWWGQGGASGPVVPAARSPGEGDADLLLSPIVGFASPADAIVRVVGPQMTCTGTLVAEDLVITAHHCVVDRNAQGAFTGKLVPASVVQIQLGGDYLPWGTVGAKTILAPPCGETGGRGDVAALVLERRLVGMATLVLSDQPPRAGQVVDSVGFGRCALSPEGIRRRPREGGAIAAVSSGAFEADASICPGDSGGPVLDRVTREVVGVVSLSAMDYDEATRARSVFARVDGTPKLVAYARLVADGADPADLPPLSCEH